MQAEKVCNTVLDPLGDRLSFSRRTRLFRTRWTIRQVVLGTHAEVAFDRATAHRTRLKLAKARRADARVAARQQGSGQWVELTHYAQLFLAGSQADQAATSGPRAAAAVAASVASIVVHDECPLRRIIASVVLVTERVTSGQIQLL